MNKSFIVCVFSFVFVLSGCSLIQNNKTKIETLHTQIENFQNEINKLNGENKQLSQENENLKTIIKQHNDDTSSLKGATQKLKTYVHKEYGFTFQYPENSTIEERIDANWQYIRLQNYPKDDAKQRLSTGQYYLEIFIQDSKKGHKALSTCSEQLYDVKEVNLGKVIGYRGSNEIGAYELCIEYNDVQFIFARAEGGEYPSIFTDDIPFSLSFVK